MACIKAKSKAYEMVAKIPMFLAGAMGGGLGDKPRWEILSSSSLESTK